MLMHCADVSARCEIRLINPGCQKGMPVAALGIVNPLNQPLIALEKDSELILLPYPGAELIHKFVRIRPQQTPHFADKAKVIRGDVKFGQRCCNFAMCSHGIPFK